MMAAAADHTNKDVMMKKRRSNRMCSVPGCTSYKIGVISLHIFPSNINLKKLWQIKLKIGKKITRAMYVCSLHFKSTDFFLPGVPTLRRRLKKTAVPSENLPLGTHNKQLSTKETDSKTQRRTRHEKRQNCCQNLLEGEASAALQTERVCPVETISEKESVYVNDNDTYCSVYPEDKSVQVDLSLILQTHSPLLNVIQTDTDLRRFTGLPNFKLFNQLVICVEKVLPKNKLHFSVKGMLMIVLVKMKLNLSFLILSYLFNLSPTSCRRYFAKAIYPLAAVLRTVVVWVEKDEIARNIPIAFYKFRKVVVVLDCTEVAVEIPKCLRCKILTYSHYKGRHTAKFLVGVSPGGLITYISDAFGGRTSDKYITMQSGVLDLLQPHVDSIMVDKGFYIDNECLDKGIEVIRPAFVVGGKPLTEKNALDCADIAKARVHVERAIQRFKLFQIFRATLEWKMIKYINPMKDIAAGIVNLTSSILDEIRF